MKQTAVLFLYEFVQLKLTDEQQAQFEGLFQQALEMEKEQIMQAFANGKINGHKNWAHKYYKETYETQTN